MRATGSGTPPRRRTAIATAGPRRCAWCVNRFARDRSFVLLQHVAPGRVLDALVLAIAERLAGRHHRTRVAVEPLRPGRPPASGHALRTLEPAIGIGIRDAVHPEVALVLRRRIDDSSDVPACATDKGRLAREQLERRIGAMP